MTYSSLESEYLVTLLRCAIKQEKPPQAPEGIDWEALFKLSKKQQVYSMLVSVIGLISVPEEFAREVRVYSQNELVRMLAMKTELEEIEKELNKNSINHMYLKGLEICGYYPKASMRQMSDYDIIYDPSKRNLLIKIMKKHGYYLGACEGYGDDFYKKPYYTFEFHRMLFSDQDEFHPDFNPWKNAVQLSNSSRFIISREDNYIYTICHLYKHYFCREGCGIRFYCDIYLLRHSNDTLDFEYINSVLDEFGILSFHNSAVRLMDALFDNCESGGEEQELLNTIFENGIYGQAYDKVKIGLEKNGGSKLKYIIKRVFPSKKMMVGNYKILEKYIVLLPFYYVYRIFEKFHHNKKDVSHELKRLRNYNESSEDKNCQ